VLISGDIDFVGKLSDLRHQVGFHVIVVHNKPAKKELKATVNAHYPWEMFTEEPIPRADSPEPEKAPPKTKEPRSNTPLGRASKPQAQRFRCQECATDFSSEGALQQHQQDKNHRFLCPECPEGFFSLAALIQHQQAKGHHEKSVTKCKICQQILKTEEVVRHLQDTQHSSFSSGPTSMLPPPLYTASATPNSATFICPVCDQGFKSKISLNQHQKATKHVDLTAV
jgi:transcription elongation factor Elf1